MIRAPYNFVPLNDNVYFPYWANQISHDVPFSDGESGIISIKISAKSPIFVRNGSNDLEEKQFSHFTHENGRKRYFVPGTSIKGMIRSILEIMSLGKMRQVDLWTPTYRDLSPTPTGRIYKSAMRGNNCGWLEPSTGSESGYRILECGKPWRISHGDIDELFNDSNKSFFNCFNKEGNTRIDTNIDAEKSAMFKYRLVENESLVHNFESLTKNNYTLAVANSKGQTGTIVFTGQPGYRIDGEKPSGKRLEFVFIEPLNPENHHIEVTNEVFNNFKFAYLNDDKNESLDWKFWKKRLLNGERIPVFYKKNNNTLRHFGLSYLYKLPYPHGIGRGIENISTEHFLCKPDLAECIFGRTEQKNILDFDEEDLVGSIKGRVQFSHAFSENAIPFERTISEVLSSPKPSYYPTYIENETGYNDTDLHIKGRKRYPIHRDLPIRNNIEQSKLTTNFIPLKSGTEFICKVRYHNLRKMELGALLTSITFAGQEMGFYHSLGMGKPLGYGKVHISLDEINSDSLTNDNYLDYIENFIKKIEEDKEITWKSNKSIIELFSMSSVQENRSGTASELSYMPLSDFSIAKRNNEYLQYYTKIGYGVEPKEINTISDLTENFDKFLKEIEKSNNKKEVRKILEIIYTFPKVSLEQIEQLSDIINKRNDFTNQKFCKGSKNYIEIFEKLKDKNNA